MCVSVHVCTHTCVVDENKVTYLFTYYFILPPFQPHDVTRRCSLSHCDGGMSTALYPTSLRGQGLGFIV